MANIRERSPGVYEVAVSTGRRNAQGRYIRVSRTVRGPAMRPGQKEWPKAVLLAEANLISQVGAGRHRGARTTLAELLDRYLEHQRTRGRAPKTVIEAAKKVDFIRSDPIGKKDIGRLSGLDLDEFYGRLASSGGRDGNGRHTTTRHHYHALIRAALNQAIKWRMISPPNPAGEAEAPRLAPAERVPPTPAQVRQLSMAIVEGDPDLAALIFVDATTGMRRGEITGLRVCDVDPVACEASIWWRCSDLPKAEAAKVRVGEHVLAVYPELGVVMLAATKNKKRRRFALDAFTLAVIEEQFARARARAEAVGVALAPDAFIWSQEADHSRPWRPNRVGASFGALRTKEGLDGVTLNDLRHFSATQLIASGIDPKAVAGRIGNDASLLLRVYAAAVPARDQEAARILGELLGA